MHAPPTSDQIVDLLLARIAAAGPGLAQRFAAEATDGIGCAWLDDVLPPAIFALAAQARPPRAAMVRRRSLGERKFVCATPAALPPSIARIVSAFASEPIAAALGEALAIGPIIHDPELYNGGLTIMTPGDYMRPHLDNSHDRAGRHRRRLVALYYVSPEWQAEWAGELTLWRGRRRADPLPIAFRPNRLVLFAAGDAAWHSVSPIAGPTERANLTTYYYDRAVSSATPRLTRFMRWPQDRRAGERMAGAVLAARFAVRSLAARLGLRRLARNPHRVPPASGR